MAEGGVFNSSSKFQDKWYERLGEVFKFDKNKPEVKYFSHCTTKNGKEGIQTLRRVSGGSTGMPGRSPLARNENIKGVWLTPTVESPPTKSPYGTQRLLLRPEDIISCLDSVVDDKEPPVVKDDAANVDPTSQEHKASSRKRTSDSGKRKSVKAMKLEHDRACTSPEKDPTRREYYLKDKPDREKEPTAPKTRSSLRRGVPIQKQDLPLLFFECAHHFGANQYIRLILINRHHPNVEWCRKTCKNLDWADNLFLEYESDTGRMRMRSSAGNGVTLEVLMVGNLEFERLFEEPRWTTVGKLNRAGYDPKLGVAH